MIKNYFFSISAPQVYATSTPLLIIIIIHGALCSDRVDPRRAGRGRQVRLVRVVGVYRNPRFMTYANAEKRWKHADE